jgi:hypothetical protein
VAVAGLAAEVPGLVARCLAMEPADRPSAPELAGRLRAALGRPTGRVAAPVAPVAATRRVVPPPVPRSGTRVLAGPPPRVVVVGRSRERSRRWTWLVGTLAVIAVLTLTFGVLFAKGGNPGSGTEGAAKKPAKSSRARPSPTVKCAAEYKVTSDWIIGFTATLKVSIQGTVDVTGWLLEFDFPGNQKIDGGWPGKYTQTDKHVSVRNDNWNAVLEAGKSYSSSILAHYTGKNDKPAKITLNGVTCSDSSAG